MDEPIYPDCGHGTPMPSCAYCYVHDWQRKVWDVTLCQSGHRVRGRNYWCECDGCYRARAEIAAQFRSVFRRT